MLTLFNRDVKTYFTLLVTAFVMLGVDGPVHCQSEPPADQSQVTDAQTEAPKEKPQSAAGAAADSGPERVIFQSPQDCFLAFKKASAAGDVAARLACLAPWDRQQRIGWYAYYLDREVFFQREHAEQSKALLRKHGVEPGRVMDYVHQLGEYPVEELAKLVAIIGSKIEDPVQFAVDAAKLVTITIGGDPMNDAKIELTKLDNRETVAIGSFKNPSTGQNDQVIFKKIDGSWLITTNP